MTFYEEDGFFDDNEIGVRGRDDIYKGGNIFDLLPPFNSAQIDAFELIDEFGDWNSAWDNVYQEKEFSCKFVEDFSYEYVELVAVLPGVIRTVLESNYSKVINSFTILNEAFVKSKDQERQFMWGMFKLIVDSAESSNNQLLQTNSKLLPRSYNNEFSFIPFIYHIYSGLYCTLVMDYIRKDFQNNLGSLN